MKTKEYELKVWVHWVWGHNEYYEAPLEHYPLLDDTETNLDLLEAYCKIIVTEEKRRKKNHIKDNASYENYSPNVQNAIDNIIVLLSDGRDLHKKTDVSDKKLPLKNFDHHLEENGRLSFENDPFYTAGCILNGIPNIREIINSEKQTADFKQFYDGNWYLFEGYESGSVSVRFNKINYNKEGIYTFDGDMIWYTTIDSRFDGNGVVIQKDWSDVPFNNLPYMNNEWESADELIECIKQRKKETTEEVKESIIDCFENYYFDEL